MEGRIREVYLAFTDILDRHEEFKDQEINEFIGYIKLAIEGF